MSTVKHPILDKTLQKGLFQANHSTSGFTDETQVASRFKFSNGKFQNRESVKIKTILSEYKVKIRKLFEIMTTAEWNQLRALASEKVSDYPSFVDDTKGHTRQELEALAAIGRIEKTVFENRKRNVELNKNMDTIKTDLKATIAKEKSTSERLEAIAVETKSLTAKETARKEKLDIIKKRLELQETNVDAQKDVLESYVKRAQHFLGLNICHSDQKTVIITMNQIDKTDLERDFLCEIQIPDLDREHYSVLRSEPVLEDMKQLEETLNATNDLSGFVVKLRQMFKQAVK